MIPVLYSETERDYGHGGIGVLTDTMNYLVTEEANGEFELYLEYPVQGAMFTELKNNRLIRAKPNDLDDDHVFRIYEVVKDLERQTVYIYATSISNDLGTNMVSSVKIVSKTAQEALNMLKANLIEPTHFNFVSDITTRSSTEWAFRNPLNCIVGEDGSLVKYWGGEVKRTNDTVYLYSRRGRDNVAVLREGKNLEGLEMTISTKGIVTKILPYMTRYDDTTGEERLIVGNIVTSPLVDNYPVKSIKAVDYTMYDDVDTAAELNTLAGRYFTYQNPGVDKPKVSIDIDIMQLADSPLYSQYSKLESLGLFDSVSVYIPRFDVSVIVKVNKIEYNGLLERADKIQCGDPVGNIFDDVKAGYTNMIVDTEAKITNIVQRAANGISTIFRGTSEPTVGVKTGDLWYKPIGEFEIEMYQWNGMEWELILSTKELNMYRPLVEAAIEAAEQAKLDAEKAYSDSVAEAERLVTAQTEAFDAEMALRKGEITAIQNDIDAELVRVDQAISDNFTSLSDTLDDVDAISKQAKSDAQTAASNAATALSNAATALSNASTALSNSQSAISKATSANNKAIKSSVIEWALSASGTTPPTTGWSTTIPTPSTTQYTWGRTTITLNDGTAIPSYNVSKMGVKGDPGAPGAGGAKGDKGDAGVNAPKITAVTQQFYLSSSNTSQTGGSWAETIPVWSIGKYYWTRVVTSYDNSTTTPSVAVLDNSLNQSLVTALEAKTATQTLSTTVSQHATQIAAKAAQTTVDSLTGRVTTAEGTINVQAGQIALKASQTSVDTLTGRVGTAETNISANTTAINLRATKSSVDTLTGRVTTAEGSITTQAGQIALRATTATVNALTGRVSTAESSISANTTAINLRATKTELTTAIDGIEVGGRNYLRNDKWGNYSRYNTKPVVSDNGRLVTFTKNNSHGYTAISQTPNLSYNSDRSIIYTFSGIAKQNGIPVTSATWGDYRGASTYQGKILSFKLDDSTGRFAITQEWTSSDVFILHGRLLTYNSGTVVTIEGFKAEKGNKATDWTPAPEDVDKAISTVQSNLTVEAGKITALTTRVSGSETNITNVTQTVSGHTSTISTLRTDVNGKATTVALNAVKSTADGNKTTISNHSGRLTTVESNVSGLQTTVASKADKTQITQLDTAILLKADKTDLSSKKDDYTTTITITGNGNTYYPLYFIRGNQSVPRVIRITRRHSDPAPGSIWNPSQPTHPGGLNMEWVGNFGGWGGASYKEALTSFGEVYTTMLADLGIEHSAQTYAFYLRGGGAKYKISSDQPLNVKVGYSTNDVIFGTNKSSAPKTSVNRSKIDGLITAQNSQISVLSDQINLRVTKGSLMSEINVQAGRTIISTGKLYLDTGSTTMTTAFVNDLNAKTLTAITANITSIRSQVLVTDSVTSTHIKAENALVDTIFGTTALVTQLTSKTAFINNIKAITISADKVTTGTLNASNVNITNLNVSKIVGLNSEFVRSNWNANGTDVSITGNGIESIATSGSFARMIAGEVRSYSADSNASAIMGSGRSQFYINGTSRVILGRTLHGSDYNGDASLQIGYTSTFIIGRYDKESHVSGVKLVPYITFDYGSQGNEATGRMRFRKEVNMIGAGFNFRSATQAIGRIGQVGVSQNIGIHADSTLLLGVNGGNNYSSNVSITRTLITFGANLDMGGKAITNQSDRRLKTRISTTLINALAIHRQLNFVDFDWIDKTVSTERQFGLIAQDAPFIGFEGDDGKWNINSSRQVMLNSLGIKELDETVTRIETFTTQHEFEIKLLKDRITQLEEKMA